ncbi:MAG TPA: hypothetical protein VFR18_04795 [Terriglobia bacterium]|nr:hypothetical protein [Terriglobia bacterium]
MIWTLMVLPLWALATIPAPVPLDDLFSAADQVLLVQVVEGRVLGPGENNCGARYVGTVKRSFKGMPNASHVEFGPHSQLRLGVYYLLFLTKSETPYERYVSTNSGHLNAKAEYAKRCKGFMAPYAIMHFGSGAMIVNDGDSNVDNWVVNWRTLITLPKSVKVKETRTHFLVTVGEIAKVLKPRSGE